jgi:hydrogenase maturation protease
MMHSGETCGRPDAQIETTLVLGIGNTLLSDEGAGVHAARRLEARAPAGQHVRYLDGGTLSFALAGPIGEASRLIVIDAAELQRPPGSVQTFLQDDMDAFLGAHRKRSVHEVGLLDLLQIARLTGSLPPRRVLIGIQPASVDWGECPTPSVETGIGVACARALELIERWPT